MRKNKIVYWSATGIIGLMMAFSAYSYLTNPQLKAAFVHLGFPSYFRIELAIAKLLGAGALLLPFIPRSLKELAYTGFAITFISAFIAHLSSGDPLSVAIFPVLFLVVLLVSYLYYRKISEIQKPPALTQMKREVKRLKSLAGE